jgi:peptidoglycan/xylan/chitin deacetylase (PgdA/CDA1 family)
MDTNDMRFASPGGFSTGEEFERYLRDAFDVLWREGEEGHPRMLSVGLHARVVGRPGRLAGLQRFVDHVMSHERVWVCRRVDIARHWAATFPPPS